MTGRACGLDFGTSNSAIGLVDATGARLVALEAAAQTIPSAVFYEVDQPRPIFGRAAIASYVARDEGRLMRGLKSTLGSTLIDERTRVGNRTLTFKSILSDYIKHLRDELHVNEAGGFDHVVMGRPVHFIDDDAPGDARAEATLGEIARAAGFSHVSFQYEPIAAALDYEQRVSAEELVLIVDIGGGTSDFSIVRVSPERARAVDRAADILANDGVRIGGTDFDRMFSLAEVMPHLGFGSTTKGGTGIMPRHYFLDLATWHRINMLYTQRSLADLKALRAMADDPERLDRMIKVVGDHAGHALAMAVEAGKIALSDADAARLNLREITGGPNPVLRRAALDGAIEGALARISARIASVLTQAGVRADQINTVFLTGGSAHLPALQAAVTLALPQARLAYGDMFGAVATGLGLEAARRYG